MSLFDTSGITNNTVAAADTPLSNNPVAALITAPISAATSNLECQIESTAASITNAAEAIANNAINTAETVAANLVTTAVNSAVNAVANTALSAVANAANSVTGMLTADATAIANNVAASFGNLFNNTIAQIGTIVKLPIPDPIAASFANGVPQSTLFATNSILSQMEAVTLGSLGAIANAAAGVLNLTNLASLLTRYGVATAAELEAAITNQVAQLGITAAYSPASLITMTLTAGTGITPTTTPAGCACGPINYAGYTDFAALAAPVAIALTGSATGLAAFYNPYLADTTDATGAPITGIPTTLAASTVNQIATVLTTTLGITGVTVSATPYAAYQSLFDGIYAISAKLGLVAILSEMAATPVWFSATTKAQARTLLSQTTRNPSLISTLLSAAGPETTHLTADWYQAMVSNTTLGASDVTNLAAILASLNTTTTAVFTTAGGTSHTVGAGAGSGAVVGSGVIIDASPVQGDGGPTLGVSANIWSAGWSAVDTEQTPPTAGGNLTIWNSALLTATQPPIATGLLLSSPATEEGAASLSLPTTGLPPAAVVSLMARGIPRGLTRNLRFTPITPKSQKVLYGNIMASLQR